MGSRSNGTDRTDSLLLLCTGRGRVAEEVYGPASRALSKDGTASDAGLKEHFQIIQKLDKGIGEIQMVFEPRRLRSQPSR